MVYTYYKFSCILYFFIFTRSLKPSYTISVFFNEKDFDYQDYRLLQLFCRSLNVNLIAKNFKYGQIVTDTFNNDTNLLKKTIEGLKNMFKNQLELSSIALTTKGLLNIFPCKLCRSSKNFDQIN